VFVSDNICIKGLFIALALGITWHILSYKTRKEQ
jgi:hypothetical protein